MTPIAATTLCLIACHGASGDHFSVFAENLIKEGYQVQVYASEHALKKFQDRNISVSMSFKITPGEEIGLAKQIAQQCANKVIITDVGNPFNALLQKTIKAEAPETLRLAYYDNPEPFVPGGYSKVAAEVMQAADRVLFANANLAKTTLYSEPGKELALKDRVGLGYYPTAQADQTLARRAAEKEVKRKELFDQQGLKDTGQKVLVYFGGNNETYFSEAFPAFLKFLTAGIEDLSNIVFVMQQHPAAKTKNIDRGLLETWIKEHGTSQHAPQILISDWNSNDVQVIADGALYYQTSMGPLFALAGIPMAQVGHDTYEDVMVRSGLCPSATNSSDFVSIITKLNAVEVSENSRREIFKSLGIQENWLDILKKALVK